jgi:putative colanic acid biosynthesis UDP-glucose lipid carrier transferase
MIAQRAHPSVNRRGLTFWAQWFCATTLSNLLLCLLIYQRHGQISSDYRVLIIIGILGSVPIYSLLHVYHKRYGYGSGLVRLLAGWTVLLAALMAASFICGSYAVLDRPLMAQWAVCGYLAQALCYLPLRYLHAVHSRRMRSDRASLIVGTSSLGYLLAQRLQPRVAVLGLIATEPLALAGVVRDTAAVPPILGELSEIKSLVARRAVRRVYLALPPDEMVQIESIYQDLLDLNVDVVWVPNFGSMMLLNQSVSQIEQFPAIYLNETPSSSQPAAALGKELFDRSLAVLALLMLAPVMLSVAAAVKLSSPGPVFFRQSRHGCNGQVIQVWKFRSMRLHDDQAIKQATRHDPRITRVGAFLRRTSLDELPQLINVVQGDMALVGPRPHAVAHNQYYSDKILAYMARHRIKPGITGLAQVSGLRGETETLEKMQRRVEKDLDYINHWTFWLDLKILIKTPFTLFSRNIY